jgi:acyl-CoA synthetase (NDP forming)
MAGNYQLQKNIIKKSGIHMTENFQEFSSLINYLSAYPNIQKAKSISVISNAGFETVASADHIGNRLYSLTLKNKQDLHCVIEKYSLQSLVSAANPLDLTPMSDELVYGECVRVIAASESDAILLCAVPLTDKLETLDFDKMSNFAKSIKEIALTNHKPIAVVIDSGELYQNYRNVFKKIGLPTFSSIEEAFVAL